MNILDKLREIVAYYEATRQVGHTTLMKMGIENQPDSVLLAHNMDSGNRIVDRIKPKPKVVSLNSLHNLRGMKKPMAIDNGALQFILAEAADEIHELQIENAKLTVRLRTLQCAEIDRLLRKTEDLKREIQELKPHK